MARIYYIDDPFLNKSLPIKYDNDKACVFCDHCTDIFWDYSNGIYATCCELCKEQIDGKCDCFIEEQSNGEQ